VEFNEKEYQIPFFQEEGFSRRKCRVCGAYFWTQRNDADTCGDAPCEEYTFIGSPPAKRSFSVDETRELFLGFFERNNHTRIRPYPVISRWREDLFVTIASIADFQPHVTEGLIPPPANPLVISQPCLRFSDVDNVGLTAGRHLVIFEMGGAHAFNYPDKTIYWKDQTVRYHHRFITEEYGVESEAVSYKEGAWSGGGNAGPCVEGSVAGLEVCTLVFMQYRVVGDRLVDMPLTIVDTGYGIERYSWVSQGTPSAFHAVYGPLLEKIRGLAGLEKVDERFLVESAKFSAIMNIESADDRITLRRRVAQRLSIDPMELDRAMIPIESAYAVADHTKALAFMLAEGVVPSNVKAGYLARLLIRRTYRLLRNLGIEDKLSDIVEWQIDKWSPSFPNLGQMRNEIHQALEAEERKYKTTLRRGQELTRRIARELKSKGQPEITEDTLAELYDSHGVPPEVVEEAAKAEAVKVTIPDNFYSTVAARHSSPPVSEETEKVDIESEIEGLPTTRLIYYDNPYQSRFQGKVLKTLENIVVLDQTAFYPKSGGQDSDEGQLSWGDMTTRVTEVQKVGNIVLHTVEGQVPPAGQDIIGEIDWERRISLMRHHTSTHLVLGAVRRVLGEHSWQAGAEKEAESSRLDVSHWDRITPEQVAEIETLANLRVMDDIRVEVSWVQRDTAERSYGFRLYQGGAVPGKEIRVVKIGEWDVEACGGTHLRSTGEVGLIKVLHTERIQDGVERIVFASGRPALEYAQRVDRQVKSLSELLSIPDDRLETAVRALSERTRSLEKENAKLKQEIMAHGLRDSVQHAVDIEGVDLVTRIFSGARAETLIETANVLVRQQPNLVLALCGINSNAAIIVLAGPEATERGVNAGLVAAEMAKTLGGGGGGRPGFGQGGGTRPEKAEEALRIAAEVVRNQVLGT
jgi:alanyl-tRNA synthetase